MFQIVAGAIIGAVLMGRTKPKTRMKSYSCFGPRTGTIYTVESMPGNNHIVVHAPDGTIALFQRKDDGTFGLYQGMSGYENTLAIMKKDLEP